MRADYGLFTKHGELRLAVEVKGKSVVDPTWAALLRSNLIEADVLDATTPLLLVTQAAVYLWVGGEAPGAQASYESLASMLAPYIAQAGLATTAWVDPDVLELVVGQWLRDLAAGLVVPSGALAEPLNGLIRGTEVVARAAA